MMSLGGVAYAQTADQPEGEIIDGIELVEELEEEEYDVEKDEIVTTGSRIKKSEFSSISPLQIIDFGVQRDSGLIDPVEILQTTEAAAGTQIDSSFQGFVLDNGPGSETIDIRGLGANRTLVLINGRRLAPVGVEGAPSQPSINLIPSSLVEDVDILLDGASSVYGSDAIAGVVNVVLKRDFEGFDVTATADIAEQGAGNDFNIAGSYGKNYDRGYIGVGVEYDYRDEVTLADRDFLSGCDTHYEIDENGEIRTANAGDTTRYNEWFGNTIQAADTSPCKVQGIISRLIEGSNTFGSIYGGTGGTNIGIPGYVDQTIAGVPIDADGDGVQDFGFQQFSTNGNDLETTLIAEQKRVNLMAFGEYTMEGPANITPYFEVSHSRVETSGDSGTFQLFPAVGPDNPFNPCGTNGVDCGSNGATFDQAFVDRWNTYYRDRDPNRDGDTRDARICATFAGGAFDNAACTPFLFGNGPGDFVGPTGVTPVVGINGDRTEFDVELQQTRLIGGFKGDIPFMNFGDVQDWSFDVSLSHSIGDGQSSRMGIREDRLYYALGNDVVTGNPIPGQAPCTPQPGNLVTPAVSDGCVPVNLFAPSLYEGVAGNLASEAERNYLFDDRNFDTRYKQTVWNAFATGSILKVPAGNVNMAVGLEYRHDELDSDPDDIARDGLFFGFFSDGGAKGEKAVKEAFAELDIPLVADKPLFRQLEINLSGRVLDDEFYGTEAVYSVKGGWRPFDSLLLRASYGTSFRSPNLKENFARPQTGFLTLFDPCTVPPDALISPPGGGADIYDPTLDGRDPETLQRCIAEGLDPITLNAGSTGFFSTEVFSEGSLELDPETSTSFTAGFSFDQPFTDSFDLTVGASYYDVKVKDSVVQPAAQFLINDCYVNERDTRSPFCDRILRDDDGALDFVSQAFINQDQDVVRGLDMNARFAKEFTAFDRPFEVSFNAKANHILEVSQLFIGDDGTELDDSDRGEFGFAKWTGSLNSRLEYKDFALNLFSRYVGKVEQDEDFVDDFSNVFGIDTTDNGQADTFSDTCGGPAVGDVNCRDVGFAGDYFVHNLGFSYNNEDKDWGVTLAVTNVFDNDPPKVDSSEVTAVSNTPIGAGYNLNGRKFFVQLRKGF